MTIDPDALPLGTRLILASEDLLAHWGMRTEDGDRITVEWGERTPGGWYEPAFTVHADDNLLDALRAVEAREARLRQQNADGLGWVDEAMARHAAGRPTGVSHALHEARRALTGKSKPLLPAAEYERRAALANTEEPAPTEPEAEPKGSPNIAKVRRTEPEAERPCN